MVQGEEDLGRRFSRVEQLRLERRRREKIEPTPSEDQFVERCRRVLFEPDQNLQSWIDGELGKIADVNRQEWNFDFRRGSPAEIPGHKWEWERVVGDPPAPPVKSSPLCRQACQPAAGQPRSPKLARTQVKPKDRHSLQKKITDYMCQRRYPSSVPSTKSSVNRSTANVEEIVLLPTCNQ